MISYESLEDEQKAIYLDIACFFIGSYIFMDETVPIFYMWQASGLLPCWSLEVLQSRSLLKIDEYNCLWMHDQLRDLGRDIVRKKGNGDVTQQSRLWERKDILEALKCKEKKKNIEAIELGDFDTNFMHYEFLGFDSLRLLILWRPNLKQRFSGTLPQLRRLFSDGAFEFGDLVLSNLVELNLFGSDVDENWDGWNKIQGLESVKILYVTFCENLRGTPVFARNMAALERLDLTGCSNLNFINPSIDQLQHLTYLSFANCYALYELPKELGCLPNLTDLNLFNCSSLSKIHESLGNLHSLRKLDLRLTSITCLPDSIGRLKKLKYLYLDKCKYLVSLPDSLGNLQSLTELDILDTQITKLPSSIGGLEKLKYLDLHDLKITQLPNSIGDLSSLVKLDLSGSKIAVLPSTMAQFSLLQFLKINECDQLQELPELPTSLIELEVKADALSKVHNLSNLQELTSLELTGGVILDWDGSFPNKLQSLSIELLSVSRLPDLSNCSQLTMFYLQCNSLKVLPNLSGLRKLDTLKIESCHELIEIPGIGSLHSLTYIHIIDCPSLASLENLRELQALEQLKLVCCQMITEIPGVGELRSLETLLVDLRYIDLTKLKVHTEGNLITPQHLTEIPNPGHFGCLASPHVKSLPSLLDLENLRALQQLKHFKLVGSQKLTGIPGLGNLRGLITLKVEDCDSLENLDNLAELKSLEELTLIGCEGITQIPGIGKLRSLTSLCIEKCPSLVSLENVGELKELKTFNIILCQRLTEIPGLSRLRCLTELRVEDCNALEMLDDITGLEELKQLSLIGCQKLTKVPDTINLESLRTLNRAGKASELEKLYNVKILANASELDKLYDVKVLGTPNSDLKNVDGIPSHVELQSLDLLENHICGSLDQLEKVSEDVEGDNDNMHLDLNLHCPQEEHATDHQSQALDCSEEYSLETNWLSSLEEITLKLRLLDICDDL